MCVQPVFDGRAGCPQRAVPGAQRAHPSKAQVLRVVCYFPGFYSFLDASLRVRIKGNMRIMIIVTLSPESASPTGSRLDLLPAQGEGLRFGRPCGIEVNRTRSRWIGVNRT
jgi:hypothetical protein